MVQKEERKLVGMNVSIDGEVLNEIYEGDYIVTKKQADFIKRKNNYESRENESKWIACHHDNIKNISNGLSLINAGAILKLIPYMSFNRDGILIFDGSHLKKNQVQFIIGRNDKTSRTIYNNLIDLGVLIETKENKKSIIKVHEKFHTFGKINMNNIKFTKIFINKLKEISSELNLNELGLLYKIMPYFHYSRYYLCSNPNEHDTDKLDYLTRNQLAEILNIHPDTINRLINKLKIHKAMLITKSGRTVRYLIHPDLMYRDQIDTTWYESVKEMINNH